MSAFFTFLISTGKAFDNNYLGAAIPNAQTPKVMHVLMHGALHVSALSIQSGISKRHFRMLKT